HRTTDDFGVPHVNRAAEREHCAHSHGGSGADDGAQVAGVLDGVEYQPAAALRIRQFDKRVLRHARDRNYPLWLLGVACTCEFGFAYHERFHAHGLQSCQNLPLPFRATIAGLVERSVDPQGRIEQLFHCPSALNSEQSAVLTCLPPTEVTG